MVSPNNKRRLIKNMTVDPGEIRETHKANLAMQAKLDKTKTTPVSGL